MEDITRNASLAAQGRLPPERVTAALAAFNARATFLEKEERRELYLDTSDRLLQRAGVVLRLKLSSEGARLSIKHLAPSGKMIYDEALHDEDIEWNAGLLPGPVPGDRLSSVLESVLGGPIEVEISLETIVERETFAAVDAAGNEIVVDLEWRGISNCPADCTLCSLRESEGRSPVFYDIVKNLRSSCEMTFAPPTLENELLTRSGVVVTPLDEGGEFVVRDDDRHVDAAYRVLSRQLGRMLYNEPGARLGVDVEYLHDMRVATRRMRAALRVFRDAIPSRSLESFKRELKWLGNILGDARDLDVHLLQLKNTIDKLEAEHPSDTEAIQLMSAMKFYACYLIKRRKTARLRMIRALDSRRYELFVSRMKKLLEKGPPVKPGASGASRRAPEAAAEIINGALDKVLKAGRKCAPDSPDEQLHRLRIKCKRLRYACEFFADLFGKPALDFAKKVIEVQDVLGDHQDAVVARGEIASFADSAAAPRGQGRGHFIGLGLMIAAEKERAEDSRSEYARAWKKFDRDKTRKSLINRINKSSK